MKGSHGVDDGEKTQNLVNSELEGSLRSLRKSISAIDLTATQVHWPFCGIECWTMLDSVCVVVVIIKANDWKVLCLEICLRCWKVGGVRKL